MARSLGRRFRAPASRAAHGGPAEPMPQHIAPMLAVLTPELPSDPERYSFEYKWDGVRALCYCDRGRMRIESRNGLPIEHRYPELAPLAEALAGRQAVLDGEIIALDTDDRPSFAMLQRRMHVESRPNIARLSVEVPAWFMIFDLLYLDGRSLLNEPLERRREMLEEVTVLGPRWRLSPACVGEGQTMLDTARRQHLEGVVAKRLDSRYEPGRRSDAWLKIKIIGRSEFVIGGWVPEGVTNRKRVGSLLVGYYEPAPPAPAHDPAPTTSSGAGAGARARLRYAGGVGTGFDRNWHELLTVALSKLQRRDSPFADPVPKAGAIYVEPALVAEVEYRRWPRDGVLQQAAFKGLRMDKAAGDVVAERPREIER